MGGKRSMLMDMGYSVFAKVRERIATDCGWTCQYCGAEVAVRPATKERLATIDHKIPLCRGGTWKRYNLTCACYRCNQIKADKTPEEFFALPAYLREAC